jgi:hypothetical protein
VATLEDLWRGRQVLGTAFEFMPAEPETADGPADPSDALAPLVTRVAREHLGRDTLQPDRPPSARVPVSGRRSGASSRTPSTAASGVSDASESPDGGAPDASGSPDSPAGGKLGLTWQ